MNAEEALNLVFREGLDGLDSGEEVDIEEDPAEAGSDVPNGEMQEEGEEEEGEQIGEVEDIHLFPVPSHGSL